ncbi:MAG: hypothetical protein ACK4HW_01975 [Roseinatronobacter sp.]
MKHLKSVGLAAAFAVAGLAAQAQTLRFAHPVPELDVQHSMARLGQAVRRGSHSTA